MTRGHRETQGQNSVYVTGLPGWGLPTGKIPSTFGDTKRGRWPVDHTRDCEGYGRMRGLWLQPESQVPALHLTHGPHAASPSVKSILEAATICTETTDILPLQLYSRSPESAG